MNLHKYLHCAALLLALALLLTACGGDQAPPASLPDEPETDVQEPAEPPEEPEPPEEEEPIDEEALAAAAAMEQYAAILEKAESYEYSAMEPTGVYRYALVPMQTQNNLPALFLEQQTTFGIGYIRVFQYDPESNTVQEPAETLMQGVGEAGGFRGTLFAAGDGNGVLVSSFSSGNGEGSTVRITVEGDALQTVTLWEGNIFDGTDHTGEEIGNVEIQWYDANDASALENWTPPADSASSEPAG